MNIDDSVQKLEVLCVEMRCAANKIPTKLNSFTFSLPFSLSSRSPIRIEIWIIFFFIWDLFGTHIMCCVVKNNSQLLCAPFEFRPFQEFSFLLFLLNRFHFAVFHEVYSVQFAFSHNCRSATQRNQNKKPNFAPGQFQWNIVLYSPLKQTNENVLCFLLSFSLFVFFWCTVAAQKGQK